MLTSLLALAAALQPPPIVRTAPPAPSARADRIAHVEAQPLLSAETIAVRVTSPEGLLWEGTLRVGPNQSASYQQNLNQAPVQLCPPGSYYDRSERRHLNLSISTSHSQHSGQSYRIEASWARPVAGQACMESGGTRTVQINQTVQITPGDAAVIEGDAGLRVRLARSR